MVWCETGSIVEHLMREYAIEDIEQLRDHPILLVLDSLDEAPGVHNWVKQCSETTTKATTTTTTTGQTITEHSQTELDLVHLNDLQEWDQLCIMVTTRPEVCPVYSFCFLFGILFVFWV